MRAREAWRMVGGAVVVAATVVLMLGAIALLVPVH